MGKPSQLFCRSGGAFVKRASLLFAVASTLAFALPRAPECDAGTIAELERRFGDLPGTAVGQRDDLLLRIAQCRYRESRWREFFALARYRRAFGPPTTEAAEKLALLDVLASLRHCRADRARDAFARLEGTGTASLRDDKKRIELALGALTRDPSLPAKPEEKSVLDDGLSKNAMHWPVGLDDERLRRADPFRLQVRVASRCRASVEAGK